MKFLKSTLAMVALFAIASVSAKVMRQQGQPVTRPVTQPIVQPIVQPSMPAPAFYDTTTGMIKQDYLNRRARHYFNETENMKNQSIRMTQHLNKEFVNSMHKEWKKRNLENIPALKDILQEQIQNAVNDTIETMSQEEKMSEEEMSMRRG